MGTLCRSWLPPWLLSGLWLSGGCGIRPTAWRLVSPLGCSLGVLVSAVLLFLMAAVALPDESSEEIDLRAHYLRDAQALLAAVRRAVAHPERRVSVGAILQ